MNACMQIQIWRVRQPAAAAASSANAATTTSSSPSDGTVSAAAASAPSQQLSVDYLSSLAKHSGVVNVVRWSPIDEQLASAGDGRRW